MDERAKDAFFEAALENFRAYNFGDPVHWPEERFARVLLKHFEEYGSIFFLSYVADQTFRRALRQRVDITPKKNCATDHFSDNVIREAVRSVIDVFDAPPRTYLYHFPVPALLANNRGRIVLTQDVFFEEFPVSMSMKFDEGDFDLARPKRPSVGITHELDGKIVYLCIRTRGLFLPDGVFGPTAEAIATAKHLLLLSDLSPDVSTHRGSSTFSKTRTGFVFDEGLGLEKAVAILLPETLSSALDGWRHSLWDEADRDSLDSHSLPPPAHNNHSRAINQSEFEAFLRRSLRLGLGAIGGTDAQPTLAPGVLEACEWAFDSLYEQDAATRILFLAIAFESLLGSPKSSIGQALGDRLTYFVGASHKERAKIRSDFADFYRLRSKVAHGQARRLTWNDITLYGKAVGLFTRALEREVSTSSQNS